MQTESTKTLVKGNQTEVDSNVGSTQTNKVATKNFTVQAIMKGNVTECEQQTIWTGLAGKSRKSQTVESHAIQAGTGNLHHIGVQTTHWKELPFAERRDLVTKMYGTISKDRVIKTIESKHNEHAPR